jgi:hypothetical protein
MSETSIKKLSFPRPGSEIKRQAMIRTAIYPQNQPHHPDCAAVYHSGDVLPQG